MTLDMSRVISTSFSSFHTSSSSRSPARFSFYTSSNPSRDGTVSRNQSSIGSANRVTRLFIGVRWLSGDMWVPSSRVDSCAMLMTAAHYGTTPDVLVQD